MSSLRQSTRVSRRGRTGLGALPRPREALGRHSRRGHLDLSPLRAGRLPFSAHLATAARRDRATVVRLPPAYRSVRRTMKEQGWNLRRGHCRTRQHGSVRRRDLAPASSPSQHRRSPCRSCVSCQSPPRSRIPAAGVACLVAALSHHRPGDGRLEQQAPGQSRRAGPATPVDQEDRRGVHGWRLGVEGSSEGEGLQCPAAVRRSLALS